MSETFDDSEIETLRIGAMGAGLLVTVSDRSFFDTFKEAGALAKHVAAAHEKSDSELVRRVAQGHSTGFGVTTPIDEVESRTLEALGSSVQFLQAEGARRAGRLPGVRARPGAVGGGGCPRRRRRRGCGDRQDRGRARAGRFAGSTA